MENIEYAVVLVALALAQYLVFVGLTGAARVKGKVEAPAVSGDEHFERMYRVQMNTLEQLVIFVPAMLLFGYYWPAQWAAVLGIAFIIGRLLYCRSYLKSPESRGPGFAMTFFSNAVLVLGSLIGAILTMMA